MAYDVKKVLNYGLNIVYGLTDSQISEIEQKVYKDYPRLYELIQNWLKAIGAIK